MVSTRVADTGSVAAHRVPSPKESVPSEPGRLSRWLRADPVRAIAAIMIITQLAWRADIASRGYLVGDDFILSTHAAGSGLTADYVLKMFNNHLLPGPMLIMWFLTRATELAYWPYAVLLILGQALVSIAFYRLLRLLFKPGWGVLIPLVVLLFSPLTLEATSWWVVGMSQLPIQLAVILAVGAHVKYVRSHRARHLVTLALSMALGLFFGEKALLIGPLLLVLTACAFTSGGVIRSLTRTVRRHWPSWVVVTAVSAGYLALYLSRSTSGLREPTSVWEVLTFVRQLVGSTLIPGLFGGPWTWLDAGDGPPVTNPPHVLLWLAWAAFLGLVAITVLMRPRAIRAWVPLAVYLALVAILLGATRLGGTVFSGAAGLAPRYVGDVVVVAAICIGIAILGLAGDLADPASTSPWMWPPVLREPGPLAVGLLVAVMALTALGVGAAESSARFADDWALKHSRDYLDTAVAELAKAPPQTVFFDQPVPEDIVSGLSAPDNLQSHFFLPLSSRPVFVTEAENPSMFDAGGHIRAMRVDGPSTPQGPEPGCGYKLAGGQTMRLSLTKPVFDWPWFVRIGYLSSENSAAVFRLGDGTRRFDVRRGLHQIFFPVTGAEDSVELTVIDPTVTVCLDAITVGNPAAVPPQ
jgi:hypothetical protein